MGMPLNGVSAMLAMYQVLHQKNQRNLDMVRLHRALNSFRLLAFVIHDPHKDRQFDKTLKSDFLDLDMLTGEDLLFFAVVELDVPNRMEERRYMKETRRWINIIKRRSNIGYIHHSPWEWDDHSHALEVLCGELGLLQRDLPCIVVTPSGRSDDVIFIRTSEVHLHHHLSALAKVARRQGDAVFDGHLQLGHLTKLNPALLLSAGIAAEDISSHTLPSQVATVFAEAVGFSQSQARYAPSAKQTLEERRTRLASVRNGVSGQSSGITEAENALSRAFLWTSKGSVDLSLYEVDGLEDDTSRFLRNAVKLLGFVGDPDFCPHMSVGQLGLGFEYEINLSVAQWIRKRHGIDLPRYFYLPQPGGEVHAQTAAHRGSYIVDVNESRHGRWIPFSLGRCLHLSECFLKEGWPQEWSDPESWAEFLELWSRLVTMRNGHAHAPDLFSAAVSPENALRSAHQLWRNLVSRHHLENIVRLKQGCGRMAARPRSHDDISEQIFLEARLEEKAKVREEELKATRAKQARIVKEVREGEAWVRDQAERESEREVEQVAKEAEFASSITNLLEHAAFGEVLAILNEATRAELTSGAVERLTGTAVAERSLAWRLWRRDSARTAEERECCDRLLCHTPVGKPCRAFISPYRKYPDLFELTLLDEHSSAPRRFPLRRVPIAERITAMLEGWTKDNPAFVYVVLSGGTVSDMEPL